MYFDIEMFVLRSSISVQVSKKIFRIINKRGVQISLGRFEKSQKLTGGVEGGRVRTFIWHLRVTLKEKLHLKTNLFWCVACLTHKFLWSVYSVIKNLSDLAWYMVWYIQYLWRVVKLATTNSGNEWRTWWRLYWRGVLVGYGAVW